VSDIQHADDILIPEIEIAPGWVARSVSTNADCDDAYAYLMSAVASIEYQLEMATIPADRHYNDTAWRAKTNAALRFKKAALQIVNQRRSDINRERNMAFQREHDRQLLAYIKAQVPAPMFREWVKASGVEDVQEAA
jgi:uncharacterized protein YebE (UPF0316 family)